MYRKFETLAISTFASFIAVTFINDKKARETFFILQVRGTLNRFNYPSSQKKQHLTRSSNSCFGLGSDVYSSVFICMSLYRSRKDKVEARRAVAIADSALKTILETFRHTEAREDFSI